MRTDCHSEIATVSSVCFQRGKAAVRLNRKTDAQHNFHVSGRVSLGVTFAHVLMETEEKPQVSFLVLHHVFVGSFLTELWLTTRPAP